MVQTPRTSGVFNLGALSADNAFEAPSLDLNFDGQASSFTRATTSPTAPKANGDQFATDIVTQKKSGTVQSKYMGPHGELVNGYVKNYVDYSTDFSQWNVINGTLTTGLADPFGGNEASTFTDSNLNPNPNTGGSYSNLTFTPPSSVTSKTWTASLFVKKETAAVNNGLLRLNVISVTDRFDLQFNAQTGAYKVYNTGPSASGNSFSGHREDFGDWWRFSVSCVFDQPNAQAQHIHNALEILPSTNTGGFSATPVPYSDTLTGSITIFGAQLETTATPSQYLPRPGNLLSNSSIASWTLQSNMTATASSVTDPLGGTGAFQIADNDNQYWRYAEVTGLSVSDGTQAVLSVYVHASANSTSQIGFNIKNANGTTNQYPRMGFTNNNVPSSLGNGGSYYQVPGTDWYRWEFPFTTGVTSIEFYPAVANASDQGHVTVFGAQLELGGAASKLVQTSGASDAAQVPRLEYGNLRTNLIPQSTGTNLVFPSSNWSGTGFVGPAGEWGYNVNPTGTNLSFVTAPDGTNTAVRFEKPATTYSVARLFMGDTAGAYTCADGVTQTVSFFIRNRLASSGNIVMQPYADGGGIADTPIYTQSDMPQNEWVRISHTYTNSSGATLGTGTTARSAWDIEFETNAAHDFELWGLQIEEGSSATDYIPTFTGARTVGEPLGLLVEESRTNIMTATDDVGGSGWTTGSITVTTDYGTAPDGTNTSSRFFYQNQGYTTVNKWLTISASSTDTYTGSVWYRGTGAFRIQLNQQGVGATTSSNYTATTEWQRATVTRTNSNTGGGTGNFGLAIVNASGSIDMDVEFWGAQVELGEGATSYIPNTSTSGTKTRAADEIALATSAFGYNTAAGTALADFTMQSDTDQGYPGVFTFIDEVATGLPRDILYLASPTDDLNMFSSESSTDTNWTLEAGVSFPLSRSVAVRINGTSGQAAIDGTLGTPQTINVAPSTTRDALYVGSNGSTNPINGHIRRFTYWPRAISDASLVAYTGANPPTIDIDRPMRRWGGITGRSLVESGDENWNNVTLLLDGSSTTDDLSAANVTVVNTDGLVSVANGSDGGQITSHPYASSILKFPTSGTGDNDFVDLRPSNASGDFDFGTGDFTIEMWAYFTGVSNVPALWDTRTSSTGQSTADILLYVDGSGNLIYYSNGALITGSTAVTTSTWHHVALVRNGGTTALYLDGVSIGSTADSYNKACMAAVAGGISNSRDRTAPVLGAVGVSSTSNNELDGYLADVRVTKGIARYTSNFNTDDVIANPASWPTAVRTLPTTGVLSLAEHYQGKL